MKRCDRFRDLILTDYIDGELDKDASDRMESHLQECGDCRAFLKEVKSSAALPFQNTLPQPAPAELWGAVRERILSEEPKTGALEGFIEKLRGLIFFPRMVPVFASLTLMLVVGSVTFNTIQVQRVQSQERGEYLASLLGQTGASENNDQGPIEHYFL